MADAQTPEASATHQQHLLLDTELMYDCRIWKGVKIYLFLQVCKMTVLLQHGYFSKFQFKDDAY
jgi:hypothetical protein